MYDKLIIIGISGVTCGGKTTLAGELARKLPNTRILSQDDYFLDVNDDRHTWIPELNHINFDILTSLDMEKLYRDLKSLQQDAKQQPNRHPVNDNTDNNIRISGNARLVNRIEKLHVGIVIVEGFSIFAYKQLVPLYDLKYYFTLSRAECFRRRSQRHYDPPDCPGYFEKCVWPEYLKQLEDVRGSVKDVKYLDEFSTQSALEKVLSDVADIVENL